MGREVPIKIARWATNDFCRARKTVGRKCGRILGEKKNDRVAAIFSGRSADFRVAGRKKLPEPKKNQVGYLNSQVGYKQLLSGGSSKDVPCEENGGEPVNERVAGRGAGRVEVGYQNLQVGYKRLLSGSKSWWKHLRSEFRGKKN